MISPFIISSAETPFLQGPQALSEAEDSRA
jgi:hypothetical protein